jgi:amino acid transporter
LALVNSALANANAGVISCSRVLFAMGKGGLLPEEIAKTHQTFRTPHIAIAANVVFATVVALITADAWGPLTAFAVTATAFVILVIGTYILASIACMVEYRQRSNGEWSLIKHFVIPAVGIIAMGFALYYTYVPLSPYPIRYALWFSPAWALVGILLMLALYRARPAMVVSAQAVLSTGAVDAQRDMGAAPVATAPTTV